ncbi:MAG TPA: prepilin peptidase, partial [Gemmatimonadaceae bacterium]|nr:prepilin peptidase [Gemmatimonadaceae bacterium]
MNPSVFATAFAFLVGLCVGSFLNVCVARWPAELSVIRPRSRCPNCGHQLAWFENVPVVSWLVLRARCRCCDERISAIYPLGEILVGVVWALCVARWGPTF